MLGSGIREGGGARVLLAGRGMRIGGWFLLVLLAASGVEGQGVRLGVTGGVGIGTLAGEGTERGERPVGVVVGVFGAVPVSGAVRIRPEVNWALKGGDVLGVEGDIRLRYIEVPVLVQVVAGGGAVRPVFGVGPAVAFPVACRVHASAVAGGGTFDCEDPRYDADLNGVDVGGVASVGLEGGGEDVVFSVEVRAGLGLNSIDRSAERAEVRTRVFTFLAGLAFPIGGGS